MNAILLSIAIVGSLTQTVSKKYYSKRTKKKGVYFFSLITSIFAALFFLITSSGFELDPGVIPYSIAFAITYSMATIGTVAALAYGPMSLTSLIISFSSIVPTIYGLVFLHEDAGISFFVGVALLSSSIILTNMRSKREEKENPISFKWFITVLLAFLGNGLCSVFQNMQQIRFDGKNKSEFMILALILVIVLMAAMTLFSERKEIKTYARHGTVPAILCGVGSGVVNLIVMMLASRMSVSLYFPILSVGCILGAYVISVTVYKERLTRNQSVAFVLGILSIIILNLNF